MVCDIFAKICLTDRPICQFATLNSLPGQSMRRICCFGILLNSLSDHFGTELDYTGHYSICTGFGHLEVVSKYRFEMKNLRI